MGSPAGALRWVRTASDVPPAPAPVAEVLLPSARAVAIVIVAAVCASPAAAQTARTTALPLTLEALSTAFEGLSRRVSPSVVKVVVTGYGAIDEQAPSADALLGLRRSGGSGVILDPNGYIVTNSHVIEGARRVQVLVPRAADDKGTSIVRSRGVAMDATIIGVDSETDLAVLKVEGKNLPALPIGDSDTLRQGQIV